jgi:tRNA dimethylallyltransferase
MSSIKPDQSPENVGFEEGRPDKRAPLVVIIGPTAVGKTEIAIHLAQRLNGEIVSADSRLFYRGMDIGTAKPTPAEQKIVPHHLIDVAEPDQPWSLAQFQRAANEAIMSIHSRRHLPFLVGGTGQFIRATIQDWEIPKIAPDHHLRNVLEVWAKQVTPLGLHSRLNTLDPEAAAQIDYRNLRRTVRAMEVIFSTGVRFSALRRQKASSYNLFLLGLTLPREKLYQRVDARIQSMLDAGFIEEVKALLARGYSPDLPAFSAIGYREIIDYLQGQQTLDESIAQMKRQTRIFIRRQANWFKPADPNIHWFMAKRENLDDMEALISRWLNES